MPLDFTLTKFRALCTCVAQQYSTLTLAEYFKGAALPERFALHEVGFHYEVLGKAFVV